MIVTTTSSKGGVGKTTTLVAIAGALADMGQRVLLLDVDPNKPLERWAKKKQGQAEVTVESVTAERFSQVFKDRAADTAFDHILIDLPGFAFTGAYKAIARSDFVIVPIGPSLLDFNEAVKTFEVIKDISEETRRLVPPRLLLNRVSPLHNRVVGFIREQANSQGLQTFKTEVIDRIAYKDLFIVGLSLAVLDKKAEAEIAAIVHEIRLTAKAANNQERGAA